MDADANSERLEPALAISTRPSIPRIEARLTPLDLSGIDATTTFDDVRQLAVVVWARTKLIDRLLTAEVAPDPRILAGLAEIEAAVAGISERLDLLEDTALLR
jgi:hypothetical protein